MIWRLKHWRHLMNASIGIDIVELDSIKDKLSEAFICRVLSAAEQDMFHKIKHTQRKIEFIAGRFAAKEAYTKCYETFDQPLNFNQVSILSKASGAPYIKSTYRPNDTLKVSISHSKHYVVAVVWKVDEAHA